MKNFKVLLAFAFCSSMQTSFAQQPNLMGKLTDEPIPIVKKHYTEKEIEEIKLKVPVKIKQLNYLYSGSFRIINQEGKQVKTESATFDIYNYEKFRKQSERVTFRLTRDGDALELYSRDEVDAQYQIILNSKN